MTSTNDGKDVKSNLTSRPKDKTYYIELYKSLEARLSGDDSLPARTGHVCDAWRRVYSLHQHSSPSTHPHLLSWLQRHTARTVLQTEWVKRPDEQTKLGAAIDALTAEAEASAAGRERHVWEEQLLQRARWFRSVLPDPWGHAVLKSLLAKEPVTDEQVLAWLVEERGLVFVTRLRALAASKCVDLALALAAAVMDRARAGRVTPKDDAPVDQPAEPEEDTSSFYSALRRDAGFLDVWDLLTDIEFVLLDKQDKRERCIELAKQTPLRDGYQLVERLRNRLETLPREKKLWKNAKEVATLIAQVVIARCMVVPACTGAGRTALYCCARSLARLVPRARLPAVTAALAAPAATARHLHTLCAAIHAQCEGEMKPFVCELYVRAITAGMNELERLKLNTEKQAEARASEQTLASWFTQLGTLLSASPRLLAECALTAFSVHPALQMFERVRRAPPPHTVPDAQEPAPETSSDFGSWANDSRTQSNLVKTSKTLQLKHTQGQANVLSTAIFTEAEGLGLGPELCQDLAVLLAGPRVKTLSWDMERELLLENCTLYMERTHGGTRALTTELKYLNLDPRAFQHLPEEDDFENDGIEKGYEQQLSPLEAPQEIWQHAFFDPEHTESADDTEVELITGPRRRVPRSSEEDEDPLSLIAHAKKERRKQARDKSKEHKKKTNKRETSKEGSKDRRKEKNKDAEKDKKPKKERKKKSERPTGSLDSLLGMKVTNMPAKVQDGEKRVRKKERRRNYNLGPVSVTISDCGSPGKLSQLDNTDPNVVIDGQFSMDELKSPERLNSLDTQKSVDLSSAVRNNVTNVLNPAVEAAVGAKASKARSTASDDSDASRSKSPYLTPNQLTNRHTVSNKVKSSISRLIQFRKTKPKLPRNPFPNAHLNERVNSPLPNHSLVGKKVHSSEDAPKVYMNKKQAQHFEAMKSEVNNLLNAAIDANKAAIAKIPYKEPIVPKKPYNEPTFDFDPKVLSPQKVYNAQRLQDVRFPHYSNSMPNLVQNSNMFSETQKAYSNYIQTSPQKPTPYSHYTTSQPPRPTSVIESSYASPTKQPEKLYSMKTTPPKAAANTLMHQTYYKSMQNLTQNDTVKFDQPQKQSVIDPTYYDQYSKSNSQAYSANPNNASLKATNQTQSQTHYNYNSMQHQKAREDLTKLYQTLPNTNLNGIHPSSSLQMNTQVSPSVKRDVTNSQSPMKSSMQTILNETLRAVSIDIAKGLSNIQIPKVSRSEHTSPAKSYGTSSHSDASKVPQSHYVHDKPQTQHRETKRVTQEKPCNIVKDATVKQHIVQTKQNVQAEQPASKVNQSSFQEFLQDLQNSINAGVLEGGKPIVFTKEVNLTPINQPSTSTPAKKPDLTQSAKQLIQQKKPETAPPTFSRLNYMHKNKQIDINAELNKNMLDHKISKAKYMKNEVMISRVDKRYPTKAGTPGNTPKDCPVLARMLDASPLPMTKGTCQAAWASGKDLVSASSPNISQNTASGSTASREHADLLLLLRNQPTLKATTVKSKPPSTSDNTQVPPTHQRTDEEKNATPMAKIRDADSFAVPKPQGKRVRTKSNEKQQQDWESVLNALRAHSTPPLGPNALDMVLNKDKKHSQTGSRPHTSQYPTSSVSSTSQNKSSNARKRANSSSRSSSSSRKSCIEKNVEAPKKQNQIEFIKKALQPEVPKISEVRDKKFTSNPIKGDDPFISGISNSDYDLLEELMDDDLRQEMWSSDEESYPPRAAISDKNKSSSINPKNNPNVCTKVANVLNEKPQVMDSKTSVCTNVPHLPSSASNSARTAVKSCPEPGHMSVITKHSTIPEVTSLPESRPVLCTNVNNQHTTTNIIVNQNDVMVNQTESTHYIANIAANNHMKPTNVIITSIPAQPMVLISQEIVYDTFPTIRFQETQVSAGLCNVAQNTFVTLNAMPNIAVYQTTQFAAPVINPVIIGNATTTTTNLTKALECHQGNDFVKEDVTLVAKLENEKKINIETKSEDSPPVNSNPTAVNEIETNPENKQPVNSNLTADNKNETTPVNSQPVTEDRHVMNTDINMNKSCERRVLSQMQEMNTYDSVDMRRLSVDSNPSKTKQDKERIKLKRESLLNRKIIHPCYHPPIPLSYTPLGKKINIGKLLQQGTPKNGIIKLSSKQKSSCVDTKDTIPEDQNVESPKSETNNENIESTDQALSTKENQKVCRRILLRSSNKLKNKVLPCKSTKIVLRRGMSKPKPSKITKKIADTEHFNKTIIKVKVDTKTPTRISRRILNKAMVKDAIPIPETAAVQQLHEKTTESSQSNAIPDSAPIDFEKELLGSKIVKTSSSPEYNTEKIEQDLTECIKNDLINSENPQDVESTKSVQVNIDRSIVNEKNTTPNNSTLCSQDPTVLLDKLKNNLGNKLVKSSSVLTPTKAPIVMTIKNRNQAIMTNGPKTKDTNTSQQKCNKSLEPEIASCNLKVPILNTIIAPKPFLHHENEPKMDTTNIKQVIDILPTVHKKVDGNHLPSRSTNKIDKNSNQPQQTLPVEMTPVIKKGSFILPETQNNASLIPEKGPTSEPSEKLKAKISTITAQKAPKIDCDNLRNLESNTPSMSNEARSTRSLKVAPTGMHICRNKFFTSHELKRQVSAVDRSRKVKTIIRKKGLKVGLTNKKRSINESLKCQETIDHVLGDCQKPKPDGINKDLPPFRKEDVIIEEIPLKGNTDPNRKCVRVKLSNGKTFKATVYGKMHVDYDTLFAEPAMRTVLEDGLTDGKRYTLNIKQVSSAEKSDPSKILDRRIRELKIKEMHVPIQTVNLISDDEDDDIRSVNTEFGTFTVKIDQETICKHQKKFTQRCVVKLIRDNILKSSSVSSLISRNKSKSVSIEYNNTIIAPQTNTTSVSVENDSSAVKIDSTTQSTLAQNISEIIEIDDSSNDSSYKAPESTNQKSVSKIIEFKSLLLEELGVECGKTTGISSIDKTAHSEIVPAVESLTNALLEDLGVPITTEILDDKINKDMQAKKDEPIIAKVAPIRHCVVKITKCDDLIKKYEMINNMNKCFVALNRCDEEKTTNHIQLNDIADDQKSEEFNIECSEDFINFDIEDSEDSQQLSRCPSASILDNLWDDTCQQTVASMYGRSSPVMDVFEALVSLGNKPKASFKLVEKVENPWPCESEWTMSKYAFSVEENLHIIETKKRNQTTTSLTSTDIYVKHPISYKASKLVAIVLKYFEENPNIIRRLQPTCKVQKRTLIKRRLNKRKRKTDQSVDNIFLRVHKLGTIALKAINTDSGNLTANRKEISIFTDVTLIQEGEHCNNSKIQSVPHLRISDLIAQETIECFNIPKDKTVTIPDETKKINVVMTKEVKVSEVKVVPQEAHTDITNTLSQAEVVEIQNKSDVTLIQDEGEHFNYFKIQTEPDLRIGDTIAQEKIECFKIPKDKTVSIPNDPGKLEEAVSREIKINSDKVVPQQAYFDITNTLSQIEVDEMQNKTHVNLIQEEGQHCNYSRIQPEPDLRVDDSFAKETIECLNTPKDKSVSIPHEPENMDEPVNREVKINEVKVVPQQAHSDLTKTLSQIEIVEIQNKIDETLIQEEREHCNSSKIKPEPDLRIRDTFVQETLECFKIPKEKTVTIPDEAEKMGEVVNREARTDITNTLSQIEVLETQNKCALDNDVPDVTVSEYCKENIVMHANIVDKIKPCCVLNAKSPKPENAVSNSTSSINNDVKEYSNVRVNSETSIDSIEKDKTLVQSYDSAGNDSKTNHVTEIDNTKPEKDTTPKTSDVKSQDVDDDQCHKFDVKHDIVTSNCEHASNLMLTTDVSLDTTEIRDYSDKLASSDSQHINIDVGSAEESVDNKVTENLALDQNEPRELSPFQGMIKTEFEKLQIEKKQDDTVNTGLVDEIPGEIYKVETIETNIDNGAYVTQNLIEHRVAEHVAVKQEPPLGNVIDKIEPKKIGRSLSTVPCVNSFNTEILSQPSVLPSITRDPDHIILDSNEPETSCDNKAIVDPFDETPVDEIPDKYNEVRKRSVEESAYAAQDTRELSSPEHVADKIEVECIDKSEPSETETSVLSTLHNFTNRADLVHFAVSDDHCVFDEDLVTYEVKSTEIGVEQTTNITQNMGEFSSSEHIAYRTDTTLEINSRSSDKNENNKLLAVASPPYYFTKTETVESQLEVLGDHQIRVNIYNILLHEFPIEEIPEEAYEVEIIDKSIEKSTDVAQNTRELSSPELDTEQSLEVVSENTQIISPIFFDNKEIIFNYHDYTKQPKIKEHAIQSEESRSPNHVSLAHKDNFEAANVESNEDYNSENDSRSPSISHDCQMKSKPDYKYELIQEDDWLTVITTENDKEQLTDIETEDAGLKFEHGEDDPESPSTFSCEDRGVTLEGIEYKDPYIGTCYMFALNKSGSSDSLEVSQDSCDVIESFNKSENGDLYDDLHNIEFCVISPNVTYSRKTLKRKMDMRDADAVDKKYRKGKIGDQTVKVVEKRYRKGKNIDCPKQTMTNMTEMAYGKEYKNLLEYCSAVKFSYSRPFHKEIIEVESMTTDWPINNTYNFTLENSADENLFVDVQDTLIYQPDPASQTLAEEIAYDYVKTDAFEGNPSDEAYETNFNMGFGEGSGRVIQNLKKKRVSNISAAALSDVKQSQPFLVSEDYDEYAVLNTNKDDQIKKIRQYVKFIELRDKVRSFFAKTSNELKSDLMKQNAKECDRSATADFPYELCSLDYIQPPPAETVVQVVQLGQLPVSAAAQNPMSCDPRVTQVSDASPPQCSVDNSPNGDPQSEIKTEYTELTTADLTLPLVQEYAQQNHAMQQNLESNQINNLEMTEQAISLEMEIKAEEKPEIKEEIPEIKEEGSNSFDNTDLNTLVYPKPENIDYSYENNINNSDSSSTVYDSSEQNCSETFTHKPPQQNGALEKTDQIAHAMNAAGITTSPESTNDSRAHTLACSLSQNIRQGTVNTTQTTANTYSKTTSITAMALQQALAQILPPPLNQTNNGDNCQTSTPVGPQVLHIVQGKNSSGNQITLVDNSQQSVISTPSGTQVLHIVQNKGAAAGQASNGTLGQQPNSFGGLSLVDAGLQQGGNQLLHIVNTGNQKNGSPGQLLKRVNLLTNLTNVQGSNEQKMVQFVCKSADGKAIQLNASHQRSMVLRLQPIETSNVQTPSAKSTEPPELSPSSTILASNKESSSQQEIKSRSIYEENYAKFIQNSSSKTPNQEKSTSLPKFNQAFGKPVFQEGTQKQGDTPSTNSHLSPVTTNSENAECSASDNSMNLEHIRQIGSPPMLIRKPTTVTTQSQSNLVQQIKQSIAPMNIQTMHGGVIYTRQIPVNIGGGQTINLITVPTTELINNEETPKPQSANQNEGEPSIIKIVPQNQNLTNTDTQEENNGHMSSSNENAQTPQPQPVLTQMRIKLPMLSKAPQMVPGARVVRPSFFQIQRNVIGGANQPVYQQLVLTAASPLGQQTIRLPQAQAARPVKVPSESQSSSSESMSSSTLEQLREFDMVLEQVKERSTVQPAGNANTSSFKIHTISSDTTDGTSSGNFSSESSSTQVLYSIGNNQALNVAYVNRKATVTTPTTSTYVRSPDSSGIADSPTSSTHVQMPHTSTSDSSPTDMTSQPKPAKVGSKSKSRNKASSNPPNTLKLNTVPPKTSSQKPLEDEQTTQRILYILAEYKEQVENSPDKDKPAPRRRSNPPSNPGSSKRKKCSGSRRSGTHDMSPVHGDDTCRTMGSEDSSCGTSQGDCNESCLDSHSPQDSPRKVARKIAFDQDPPLVQTRPQPHRNVIVADGQTITVARGTTGKPTTAVLMPANYILPVSMVKGGQQIAIMTNRGPKLLTVGGEAGTAGALLLQRLIGPGGLKPVLARPGVRQVRLPATALHNLQAFNLAAATTVQNPDSTASPSPGPTPPELVDSRATSSPWTDRDDVKPERGSSPEGSEPWNLPASEYSYEETVRTDNMDRTVLDAIPDRYSPDMEAQRIFDKMFDVDSKKSYAVDSPRCAYDIDASDCDDKAYQVVQRKDGTQRQHRLTHVSAAALRHKYAILEHELNLQKSLSEECEDLGVDSPSASELFPEAELLFATSPAHEHNHDAHHSHTPQPIQSTIPQPDLEDQIATDHLISREVDMGLDVGIVTVAPDGSATIALDQEEFARSHPNTTFHSEPTDGEVQQPFTITGLKGRHITSTIFHSNSAPATVLMTAPQATVISQASDHAVKYEIENMMNSMPGSHNNDINLSSVLVKDDGLTRFDSILTDSRELHLGNTASAIVHSSGNAAQVIRRVRYEDDKRNGDDAFLLIDEPGNAIAGDDAEMVAEDRRDAPATLASIADVDDDAASPGRHAELFWESNSASSRADARRPLDFSSDSDKCCKSPSDSANSTDSSGPGARARLDSVIKEARRRSRGSGSGSPPLRTYPAARACGPERSVSGKTRAGERSPEARRRASARGVVKRGCPCCSGPPAPPRKRPRPRKPDH